MEIEQAQEKAKKIEETQNLMMEDLSKEAIEHGNESAAKTLKEEVKLTDGQSMLIDLSKGLFEPIMNNRFIVSFPTEFNIISWTVKSITMPIIEKRKCSDTVVFFRKFISPLTSDTISKILNKKNFEITVKMLYPTGETVETWAINVKKILSVDFGNVLSYEKDSVSEIKVVFKTKDCILRN